MFRQRKRCYDVTLSRLEGSTTRHLASAQYWTGLAGGNTGRFFLTFGGPVHTDRISNCPLDSLLTYKNLIYLLNLQVSVYAHTAEGRHKNHLFSSKYKMASKPQVGEHKLSFIASHAGWKTRAFCPKPIITGYTAWSDRNTKFQKIWWVLGGGSTIKKNL